MKMEIPCHAYPYHEHDPYFPETGPENLVRMAETYGILIRYLGDDYCQMRTADGRLYRWGWWYEIEGPPEHLVHFLAEEYAGGEAEAREIVYG